MRHHSRKLRFCVRRLDGATIDVNISARQRERVDRGVVHALVLVRIFISRRARRQFFSQIIQVIVDLRVFQHSELLLSLSRVLLAQFDVLFRTKYIDAGLQGRPISPDRRSNRKHQRGESKNHENGFYGGEIKMRPVELNTSG